ncbi:protein argonaute 4-like [Lycium barbarum]|uniref:protein argonaute 4-like n=1 Tax=Lycium barbarum TaxID=112863 RepID=UPI00293F432A|nr:protein argonaute 4-like [Lycium barbarum]
MQTFTKVLEICNYNADPLLGLAVISISNDVTHVEGRILPAAPLQVGKSLVLPEHGKWSFYNNKELVRPLKLEQWGVVNFCSDSSHIDSFLRDLQERGQAIGLVSLQCNVHTHIDNHMFAWLTCSIIYVGHQ